MVMMFFPLLVKIHTVSSLILGSNVQAQVRTIDTNKSSVVRGKRYSFPRPQPRIPSFIRQSSQSHSPPFPNDGNDETKKTDTNEKLSVQQQTSVSLISRLKKFSLTSSNFKKALIAIIVMTLGY